MMGLRKLSGFWQSEFEKVFGRPVPERFLSLFSEYENKGWCVRRKVDSNDTIFAMSRTGMLFLNRFLEELC